MKETVRCCPLPLFPFLFLIIVNQLVSWKAYMGLVWHLPFLGDLPSTERLHSDR